VHDAADLAGFPIDCVVIADVSRADMDGRRAASGCARVARVHARELLIAPRRESAPRAVASAADHLLEDLERDGDDESVVEEAHHAVNGDDSPHVR
jgi:hypothetical protein